jgi:hypothetical protein
LGFDLKLTAEQEKLLAEYGPVSKPVWKGGAQVGFVEVFKKPCPLALRKPLDEALGCLHEIRVQGKMVDDWLVTVARIKITPGAVYESAKIDEAFARYRVSLKAAAATPEPEAQSETPPATVPAAAASAESLLPAGGSKTAQSPPAADEVEAAPSPGPEGAEQLTYAQIAHRLGCSAEAARALVKRRRLPRTLGSDGKTLVAINL